MEEKCAERVRERSSWQKKQGDMTRILLFATGIDRVERKKKEQAVEKSSKTWGLTVPIVWPHS